jgi:SAM-dependent methyltransferase
MPIRPGFLERLLFFTFNAGPAPVLDIWSGIALRVAVAAVRLGVFEALADGPLTPERLAQKISADPGGMRVLLPALAAIGYVREQNGEYANSPMTAKWMLRRTGNFGAGFEFWAVSLFKLMDNLEDTLRTGRPPLNLYEWIENQPETSRMFQEWMVAIAGFAGDEILKHVPVPSGARRLLDVGGGHGRYAVAFCQRYPDLSATVFDSPQALKAAEATLAATGMAGRVALQTGNFLADDLGAGYDVALLFNIVHGFSDEQNQALVNRVVRALNPGGLLVVVEQLAGRTSLATANATKELLSISYFHLLGGHIWDFETVRTWLAAAQCANVRRIDSPLLPGTSIVLGRRRA